MSSALPKLRLDGCQQEALWALDATTGNVILADRDFHITFISGAAADLISQESVVGKTLWEAWPGNVGTDLERNYRNAMSNGVPVCFLHGYSEPDRFDLLLEIHVFPNPGGLAIFFRDVSEARRNAARDAADQQRLAKAIQATDLGVWRVNLPFDGKPFYLSPQVRRHFGISDDEEVAMDEFLALLHPEDVQMATDAIMHAIEDRVPYDVVYRTVAADRTTRWVRAYGNAFYREDGTPYQFDGYTLDYTERVETEEALQRRVAERTAELQRSIVEAEGFNYSISHDLRAPLRAIVSTSRILLEEAGPLLSDYHRNLLDRQAYNAIRLGNLIDELLRLSRLARVEVRQTPLDITAKVRSLVEGLDTICKFQIQEGMEAVGDCDLVRTVLQNLIENACKFSPNGGTIRIGKAEDTIYVSDQGLGFDMKYAPKIFLPFERLVADEEFPGIGIGLANAKRIVERHGGRIWVESEPGVGSTFFFTLRPSN